MKRRLMLIISLLVLPLALASTASTIEKIGDSGTGLTVATLNYDPSPAQPGQFLILYIKAENSGGDSIKDSKFMLMPEYPFSFKWKESDTRTFGLIGGGQQVLLEYDLFVDKNAIEGTYEIPLRSCTNYDCSTYAETTVEITVNTGGSPKVEIGLESNDILSAGKTGEVTIHLINRGKLDTKFVVVELSETEQFELITPGRIYIGELESDDFETAEFKIYVNANLDSTQILDLPLTYEYTDANDKDYFETTTVNLRVYSQEDLLKMGLVQPDKTGTYLGLLALAIFGFIAYKIIRKVLKKRKRNAR